MIAIQLWLARNMIVVQFVYGLSFFALGLVVAVQNRLVSHYQLARRLWALSVFAFIHAAADWGLVFIPLRVRPDQSLTIAALWGLRTVLGAVSFGFLMHFGLGLLVPDRSKFTNALLRWLAPAVTLLWLSAFFVYPVFHEDVAVSTWYWVSEVWSRYMLGLPSGLIVAFGLLNQVEELTREQLHAHVRNLYVSAAFFALYGLTAGLVVPRQSFWPASVVNTEMFLSTFGIPIELIRTVIAAGTAVGTVRLMGVFNVETTRRLYQAEEERAILSERERIARELHDGILQTLYGVGLGLHTLGRRLPAGDGETRPIVADLTAQLSGAIWDLRHAITDLHQDQVPLRSVAATAHDYAGQFSRLTGLPVIFAAEGFEGPEGGAPVPGGFRKELLQLMQEGLSNAVRHAEARMATVLLALQDDTLVMRVEDDGSGFDAARVLAGADADSYAHNGLRNMRSRAEERGGLFRVESAPGKGTHLLFQIPVPPTGAPERLSAEEAARS